MRNRSQLIALAREAINPALVIDADVVEYRGRPLPEVVPELILTVRRNLAARAS